MTFTERSADCIKRLLPETAGTCIWIICITAGVSFAILLLRFFNILPWISDALSPVFVYLGLPGEAALSYVTGYFVNCYSAIAVAVTLGLGPREMTILMTMVLCSHNMLVETAVQQKTGASATRMMITRTLSAIVLAAALNLILPGRSATVPWTVAAGTIAEGNISWGLFRTMFLEWLASTSRLVVKIAVIIFALNIVQGLLKEFGVMKIIAKVFRPLMHIFGLRARCAFLWLIANIVGLAYGAAAMMDEVRNGSLTKRDIRLTNAHIGIAHSNLEDLIIVSAVGATWWILLLSRWIMAILLVWGYRLEMSLQEKLTGLSTD